MNAVIGIVRADEVSRPLRRRHRLRAVDKAVPAVAAEPKAVEACGHKLLDHLGRGPVAPRLRLGQSVRKCGCQQVRVKRAQVRLAQLALVGLQQGSAIRVQRDAVPGLLVVKVTLPEYAVEVGGDLGLHVSIRPLGLDEFGHKVFGLRLH